MQNSRIAKEVILKKPELHRSMWFLLKETKDENEIQKIVKMLSSLFMMDNFDYTVCCDDYDFIMTIANR